MYVPEMGVYIHVLVPHGVYVHVPVHDMIRVGCICVCR